MNDSKDKTAVADEELIGVLAAISVVSKRLARQLIQQTQANHYEKGGKEHEQNERNGYDHQRVKGYCIFY